MGQSPPSATYNSERRGLPFFQGKAEFTELHPVVKKWCSEPNRIAEANDILVSVRAPVGATNIANQKCCIGRGLAAVRYSPQYKFLFYFLRLIGKRLDEKGTGTTFRAISGEVLRETDIPFPPLPEQDRIVESIEALFSELDNGIEQLKTAQQQLKVYRQAVLKWAFEGKLTEEWRTHQPQLPSAEKLLDQIKTEREEQAKTTGKKLKPIASLTEKELAELPELPKEWGWKKLGNVVDCIVPNRDKPKSFSGKILWITTPTLDEERIEIEYSRVKQGLTKEEVRLYNARVIPSRLRKKSIYGNLYETKSSVVRLSDCSVNIHTQEKKDHARSRYEASPIVQLCFSRRAHSAESPVAGDSANER